MAETLADVTIKGDPALVPMAPAVDVRFNVGALTWATVVMLLFCVSDTEVTPVTALLRLTAPPVAVNETVLPEIVPPVLVKLVAATMLNAPPEAAVPAWEFPEMLRLPAEERKMP